MLPLRINFPLENYKTPFYTCYQQVANFNGFNKTYYVVDFNSTAAVICINKKNEVLLTKQYRFLINSVSLEVAGGGLNDGEDFIAAAKREFLEETGYEAQELIPLCNFMPGLDNVKNLTRIYLCTKFLKKIEFSPKFDEILELEWVHIDYCLNLISKFKIMDGTSIMAISLAKLYILQLSDNN